MIAVTCSSMARIGALTMLGLTLINGAARAQNSVAASYTFNDTLDGEIGNRLAITGPFGYETDTVGGQSARVVRFPANAYFTVDHDILPNGGGIYVNQYTLLMDIKVPAMPSGWCSLFQTSTSNANDGDGFIRGSDLGIGISGDYTDTGNPLRFTLNTWQRIVVVIDTTSPSGTNNTVYRVYNNGQLQNVVQSPSGWGRDGRFSLNPVLHIFADESGDTSAVLINNFQIRSYPMSSAEVAALGGPTAAAIPLPGSTLSGTMDLEDIDFFARPLSILLTFRPDDMSGEFTLQTTVKSNGVFKVNVPSKNYQVRIKGANYLADVVAVDASGGNVSGIAVTLKAGDANDDNAVDVLDLDLLIQAFDSLRDAEGDVDGDQPSPHWNALADFNQDGSVDVMDLDLLIRNFDQFGDELP